MRLDPCYVPLGFLLVSWMNHLEHRSPVLWFLTGIFLIVPPSKARGQVSPIPKLPSLLSFFILSWRQETLVWLFVFLFPLTQLPSRFSLLTFKSLFFFFFLFSGSDQGLTPLNREWSWDNRTYWWKEKRASLHLSEYYPGLFVLCRH